MGKMKTLRDIIKFALLGTGLAAIISCATVKILEKDILEEIRNRPYIKYVYDCKNKSMSYYALLKKKGYDAWVAYGTLEGEGHAWVEYRDEEGIIRLIEPTGYSLCSGKPREKCKSFKTYGVIKEGSQFPFLITINGKNERFYLPTSKNNPCSIKDYPKKIIKKNICKQFSDLER
ncbi:hypothetical protein HZB88_03570 [archaeon]|nr:hypothetical protein [archaeon]